MGIFAGTVGDTISMTNHEFLCAITGEKETPEKSAVKSLLAKIQEDYENDVFKDNYNVYLSWYQGFLDWLKSEKEENNERSTVNR